MSYLALLLMAPWLVILGWAYWYFPRTSRTRARRLFDTLVLVSATVLTVSLTLKAFHDHADAGRHVDALGRHAGAIWQQVLPALYAYGAFAAVLVVALIVRAIIWPGSRR